MSCAVEVKIQSEKWFVGSQRWDFGQLTGRVEFHTHGEVWEKSGSSAAPLKISAKINWRLEEVHERKILQWPLNWNDWARWSFLWNMCGKGLEGRQHSGSHNPKRDQEIVQGKSETA